MKCATTLFLAQEMGNITDALHAQGQLDSEQKVVSEPVGSTVHEQVEKQRSQTHVTDRREHGAVSPYP